MPDHQGKLTPQEIDRVILWIRTYWDKGGLCPVSGHNNWTVGPTLIATTPYTVAGEPHIGLSGSSFPMVLVICTACGYTRFLNALIAGVVPSTSSVVGDAPTLAQEPSQPEAT